MIVGAALLSRRAGSANAAIGVFGALAVVDLGLFIAAVNAGPILRGEYLWPAVTWFAIHLLMVVAAVAGRVPVLVGAIDTTSGRVAQAARRGEVLVDDRRELPLEHPLDLADDPVAAVQALTDGNGADVCIEAVGHPAVLEQAFFARDLAGRVVQVGVPTPDMRMPDIPMIEFFGRGGALKPSWYGDCLPSRDFPLLVDLHLQGRLPLERFVSETIGLDGVEEAFHKMERGEVLRSVVVL